MPSQKKACLRSRCLGIEHLEPRMVLSGTGLAAQYFHNVDFSGLAGTRTEAISHDWGIGSPGFGMDGDNFSVRWTGQIEPQFSELYTFRILSDEGVRVWLDGRLLIDDWQPHTARARHGTMMLEAGQRYDIRVDYYEVSGPAEIELSWASLSQPMQVIPATRMYESPAGVLGTYRDEAGGSLTRVDATIDFNWGLNSPGPGIAADDFNVIWSGQVRADYGEEYVFSTVSDDGVRLWIGGELVIDNWTLHSATEDFGSKWLEPGKWYDFRLEYFEHTGAAQIELRWSSPRQTGEGVFEIVPQENLRAMMPTVFHNPLGPGADPWVFYWEGDYYMTRSQGNSVWINRAESLQDIHHSNPRNATTLAWAAPPGTNYSGQIWAPELHRMGSNWYIYVAASDGNNHTHRMHVLERNAEDPFGPYEYLGQITMPTDRWAIDGTVFQWDNTWYFVWSGWPGFSDGVQNLYIAEMRNPWTIEGDRALLSTPQFAWERHGLWINEGPQILIHEGHLHIIYSASGYWTPQYALGRLTYNGTGSLLDSASWTKHPQAVFQANSHVVGTGHASFVKSPDGNQHWIAYHAHANPTHFTENRVIRIQPFSFRSDGTPDFGQPLPSDQWLVVPSAGAEAEPPFLPGDFNADGTVDETDHHVWRATFGSSVFPGVAADASQNGTVDAADYVLWRRHLGAVAASPTAAESTSAWEAAVDESLAETWQADGAVSHTTVLSLLTESDLLSGGAVASEWHHRPTAQPVSAAKHPTRTGAAPHNSRQQAWEHALAVWSEQISARQRIDTDHVAPAAARSSPERTDEAGSSALHDGHAQRNGHRGVRKPLTAEFHGFD